MATPSWERIVEVYDPDGELRTTTDRMEVPGGWIYRELTQEGVALAFVPEPNLFIQPAGTPVKVC